jgi:hypothetical protein
MFAVTDHPEIRASDRHLRRIAPQTPVPVFRAAYKELCTRLWIELELLAQAIQSPSQDLVITAAIFRLELVVLIDACRSPSWRRMLSPDQRDSLCSMLTDVLAALYVEPEYLNTAILEAQDRVLDELLLQSQPSPTTSTERGPHIAINELVSLIEAQAAARFIQ